MATLTLGLPVHGSFYRDGGLHQVVELAAAADAAGIDRLIVPDHIVMGAHSDQYPWGEFPFAPDVPWMEPLSVLAACAAATSTIRLCTGVLIAPLRPAIVLAKTAATIDVLAQGRLDLGVGTGWQREELEGAGLRYEDRGRILTDTIAACRALWTSQPASFASETVSFEDLWCAPAATRPQGPPVFFSGTLTGRNLRRIVELGDGWLPIMGTTVEQLAIETARLRTAWDAAGRGGDGPEVFGRLAVVRRDDGSADLERTIDEGLAAAVAAGATTVQISLPALAGSADEAPDALAELGRAWQRI